MTLMTAQRFAGYTVLRRIGEGGMGEVYLAEHPRLPRRDALKVLRPEIGDDHSFRERFGREADSVAGLDHPNIVTLHDRGESDGRLWIATQYIDGTDAAELVRQRYPAGMPVDEALAIITSIAEALDYAHDRGILHRDVKPANILLAQQDRDGGRRAYLADFGIARPLEDPSGLTATNITLGTVAYAAPEQLMGEDIDGRADQYALAATAYHFLTGVQPYLGNSPAAVIGRHLTAEIPAISDRRPELAALDHAMSIAMAKRPAQRFGNCRDFAAALAGSSPAGVPGADPTHAGPTVAATRTQPSAAARHNGARSARQRQKRSDLLVVAAVAAALTAVVGSISMVKGQAERTNRTSAESKSPAAPTPAAPAVSSPAPAASPEPAPTFEAMRGFITEYYSQLPAAAPKAWAQLGARYQERVGLQQYLDFWSTVQSVAVISVAPRDATSVLARLAYAWKDGHPTTEERWFSIAAPNGAMLIDDSEIARSPAADTVTATPSPTPIPAPGPSAYDRQFLSLMAQEGWGCTDTSDPNQCDKKMVSFAHQICSYSGASIDVIYRNFPVPSYMGPREERRAIANAQQAYPSCTFTES